MGLAIKLLFVGMITVFIILTLVVLLGKALIHFTNKFDVPVSAIAAPALVNAAVSDSNEKHKKAIELAIKKLSQDKMIVTNIVKK